MKVRILGVPLDLGQERRGVDMGPSAIRAAGLNSVLKGLNHHVEDAGNVPVKLAEEQHFGDRRAKYLNEISETCEDVARRICQTLEEGQFPISLGGDHSVAVGTVSGISKFYREREQTIGLIWIDAHGDMNTPESSPSGNVHGMPFASLLGIGPEALTSIFNFAPKVQAKDCVLVGVRDVDAQERKQIHGSGVNVFTMRDIDELGMRLVMQRSLDLATRDTAGVAISFDMDVVDPDEAPGVGTAVPGGMTFREAHLAMEIIADSKKMASLEIVEVNPILDTLNRTAALAVGLVSSALGKKIL
ncbi:MAG TPA: arginase [Terriglobia bacterium]|nr:arginase [Terriglobia bacterium]